MALKNMIKVGDKVTFGRAGEKKVSGTVVKCNPKTAHVKTSKGTFSVTYGLIQKPSKKKVQKKGKAPFYKQPAKKKTPARKKPVAKKKPITRAAVNKHNPANFTKKGERMYEHIKAGYLAAGKGEKDAKQIAASTVYMKSRTIPGLVKKKRTTAAKKNPPKCSTTGRYAVIVRSGSKDHCTFATNNRAMANRAAKAMAAKGKNAFVWDKEKRK